MRRAHEDSIGLARPIDVVGVLALAGDEALIFLAPNGSADAGGGHGFPPRVSCWTSILILACRLSLAKDGSLWGVCVLRRAPRNASFCCPLHSAAWRAPPMAAAPAFTAATILW